MKTMTAIAMVFLVACSADEPTAVETAPRVDTSALASHSLGVNSLPQMQLLATENGREALSRIVSCALPRGASITAITRDGTPYSFTGGAGLAPGWAEHAPSASERTLVTACVEGRPRPAPRTAALPVT